MDEKQLESWRTVRAKGRLRYVLLYGGLFWGAPSGLLMVATDFLFQVVRDHLSRAFIIEALLPRYPFYVAGFYLSGCVLGLLMWNRYEREYLSSLKPNVAPAAATQVVGPERQ
jgi:hypothetical protein